MFPVGCLTLQSIVWYVHFYNIQCIKQYITTYMYNPGKCLYTSILIIFWILIIVKTFKFRKGERNNPKNNYISSPGSYHYLNDAILRRAISSPLAYETSTPWWLMRDWHIPDQIYDIYYSFYFLIGSQPSLHRCGRDRMAIGFTTTCAISA